MFKELIKRIAAALGFEDIPYMIIGGQAVLYYGEPRFTKDIDITLGVDTSAIGKILSLTSKLKLTILVNNTEDFVNKTMVLPTVDSSTGIRIDFIFSYSAYERQAIKRAKSVKFDDTQVSIASLEDVIIHKIIAGRPRDIEDVKTILLKNPGFDRAYIIHWVKQFDKSLGEGFLETFKEIEKELKTDS